MGIKIPTTHFNTKGITYKMIFATEIWKYKPYV